MGSKVIPQKGQSFIELAFILPVMFLLLLGLIDLGYALYVANATNRLSREGANLASRYRGTLSLLQIKDAMLRSAISPLDMNAQGAIFLSMLTINDNNAVFLEDQVQHVRSGLDLHSRLGDGPYLSGYSLPLNRLTQLLNNQPLNKGESIAVVEVLYEYKPITPVGNFGLNISLDRPLKLYNVATFFVALPSPTSP